MRLYVSADMEGTAGVCSWNQVNADNRHEYPVYRRYMTQEVAAAIEGARSVESCEVTINDSHWDMRNLLWDDLPGDVRIISGRKPFSMAERADGDLAFFTGYHGGAGTADAVLSHTYSDDFYRVSINGIECSEAVLNAAYLGERGIPVALITGDETIVDAAREHLPWAVGVAVKASVGYYSSESMTPRDAREAIFNGAAQAVRNRGTMKPFCIEGPVELVIEMAGVAHADFIELLPGFTRTGARTLARSSKTFSETFEAFLAAMRLAGAADAPA